MDVLQNEIVKKLVYVLLIAGAINWGLVAYNGTDIVRLLANTVGYLPLDRYLKIAVGIAGLIALYHLITMHMPMHMPKKEKMTGDYMMNEDQEMMEEPQMMMTENTQMY